MKINKLITFIFFLTLCINQELSIETGSPFNGFNSINNNKFNLNQSFGLSVSNLNGMTTSNAIFKNNLNYNLTEKLNLESNIYLISPTMKDYNNTNNFDVKYDFLLDYKISETFQFKLKMTNINYYNNFNSIRHSILMDE